MTENSDIVKVSAPGSIMITGEHAVVYGYRAIVCAIEQRIFVTLRPRADRELRISSQIAPALRVDLDHLPEGGPYRFVTAAITQYRDVLFHGFDLDIRSEINPTLGLGSSAAVTIACLGALAELTGAGVQGLHAQALAIVRRLQGRGSGADLAASLTGGFIVYKAPEPDEQAAQITPLKAPPAPLSLKYSGYKTPTAEVLSQIAARMEGNEGHFRSLYAQMGQVADATIAAAQTRDWGTFFNCLNQYQEHMSQLGVSDQTLSEIIAQARLAPGSLAAKISGSGLGDCVLAFGPPPDGFERVTPSSAGLLVNE